MTEIRCPKCGSLLQIEDDENDYYCPYCGEKIIEDGNPVSVDSEDDEDETVYIFADTDSDDVDNDHLYYFNRCPVCGSKRVKELRQKRKYVLNGHIKVKMRCKKCGHEWNTLRVALAPVFSEKKQWKAFILCLFFGIFGAHYFYVGRWKKGLVCIFTFNFLLIGNIKDLFIIAFGHFKDKYGLYLN